MSGVVGEHESVRSLAGKRALVTGGSRGIGRGIVSALASQGVNVAFSYQRQQQQAVELEQAVREVGVDAVSFQLDVSDRQAVRESIVVLRQRWGEVDILVNNAGMAQEKPFEEITDQDWERMLDVHLKGAFIHTQEVLPGMCANRWGRIINISSVGGQWGGVNQIHYAVAKSGLIGLTRSIAKCYSGQGVTCNAIAPGLIETEMVAAELQRVDGQEKMAQIPVGRLGSVNEVAATVKFLVSEEAAYLTGQTLNLNGGLYFG